MENNVNYTVIGAFIITLVTGIVLTIIWLSSGFSIEQYNYYLIYMQESVSGLSIDSAVEYNGVEVGTVKQIELTPENPRLVEVLVNIKKNTPITRGTRATLATRGLTGLVYIALKDRGINLGPLVTLPGHPYPIIPTDPSIFTRLDTTLTGLSKDLRNVSEAINRLLDDKNLQSFKAILMNLQSFTANLAANNAKLNTLLANTTLATQQLAPFISASTSTMKMLQTQTLPMTYDLINNLNSVSHNLNDVSMQLKANPSIMLRGTRPTLGPGESQ
jgi:phospholipid/cholesterol/gamma-HCH transport system substrate-binding protein